MSATKPKPSQYTYPDWDEEWLEVAHELALLADEIREHVDDDARRGTGVWFWVRPDQAQQDMIRGAFAKAKERR